MTSFSIDRRVSLSPILGSTVALLLALGCSDDTALSPATGSGGGGGGGGSATSAKASSASSSGGTASTSSTGPKGGSSNSAGGASGGAPSSGGSGKGGSSAAPGSGGTTGAGETTSKGGTTSTGKTTGTSGAPGRDAGVSVDAAPSTGSTGDGGSTVNCEATMPQGGTTKTGKSVYGTANGLGYGIWTNGDGGSITVFDTAHAFSASWSESKDFLAHLGLDFRPAKEWTNYGTITADFSEKKSGTAGGFSMIGIYGWTQSPCVEWYINEDSWKGLGGGGSVTATIDGGTYTMKSLQTNGTGGANACESGHTGAWTQMISTRKTARTCGTVTVSDHFKAWEAQGWKMGVLTSVHINVEVGGGTGSIDFPVANVTTTSK